MGGSVESSGPMGGSKEKIFFGKTNLVLFEVVFVSLSSEQKITEKMTKIKR